MLNEVLNEIDIFGQALVQRTRKNLKSQGMVVSGVLLDSIRYNVDQTEEGYIFEFLMVEYGYYQDEGVQGANPGAVNIKQPDGSKKRGFQKAPGSRFKFGSGKGEGSLFKGLDPWVVKKNIRGTRENGRFVSRASVKTAIAKSIFYQGLPPRKFFSRAWDQTTQNIDNQLALAYIKDVEAIFIELIKTWVLLIYKVNQYTFAVRT